VCLDGEKIKLCFINFVANAIEAMPDGGVLKIKSRVVNNQINLLIGNTGDKIPDEDIEKIFEPFFTTKKEGTGLGLAMTKLILERHYGSVYVDSSDKETYFKIVLPLKIDDYISIV
jgi:signal transduction histidine kinase